jgi:hypothetical protein
MSDSIKIVHTANRGRVVNININDKKFTTPTRAITHSELTSFYKVLEYQTSKRITDVVTPPNNIQETVLDFHDIDLRRLVEENEFYNRKRTFLKNTSSIGQNRVQLCNIMLRNQSEPIGESSIDILTHLQRQVDSLDAISIPDPLKTSSEIQGLANALTKAQRILDDFGEQRKLVPFLDLDTSPAGIRSRLLYLVDSGYRMIAFRYRPNIPSAYAVAETVSDKDLWIHLSGVHKQRSRPSPVVPQIHLMPFFSFDSMASYKAPAGGGFRSAQENGPFPTVPERPDPDASGQEIVEIKTSGTRINREARFDSAALGYLTRVEHNAIIGESLNCDCFICQNLNINQFFEKYGYNNGSFSRPKMRVHLLVHELHASYQELNSCQMAIKESDYATYLWNKPVIQRYNTGIPEIDGQELLT